MDQNIDSSGSGQIQTPQYPVIHQPSQEMSEEVFQAKGDLMKSFYDDEEYSIQYKEYLEKFPDVIAPILPTEEPEYSLSMRYEHLSTTLETELDEVTESSAKNLLPIPSEYEVTSDDDSECEVPIKYDSSLVFTTFSNPLFDNNDDFTSSDDESLSEEDVPIEEFKVYSNPLFDDKEINSNEIDPQCFNAKSDLIESLLNRDTLIDSSHINPILPEIKEVDFDLEEEILLDDPLFPRPPPEPPDVEFFFDLEPEVISAVMNNIDELNEDECFDPGGEIDDFTNVEYDDYFPFMFVIRIFLPYLIYPEVSPLLLFAESEDTIFDPGISV
nr:hypothetical protein [Tanacetum cinerariifolium]